MKKLTTPHGSLDCARSKLVAEGNKVTIDWAVELDPTGLGLLPRPFFVDAKGGIPETRLGWTRVGTYGSSSTPDAGAGADAEVPWAPAEAGPGSKRAMSEDDLGGGDLACSCRVGVRSERGCNALVLLALTGILRRNPRGRTADRAAARGGTPRSRARGLR